MAEFEWDPIKNDSNIEKHGIDFATARLIWEGPVYERVDDRQEYGGIRFQAFGLVEDHVLTVVFTWRGGVRRLISARRANSREQTLFETGTRKGR